MKIQEMFLTPNAFSRPGTKLKQVTKIAIHYVGNTGSSAIGNRNYFESLKDKKTTYASSHYIIGLDGEIIQCIPEYEVAYCTNDANSYSVSIENCHPQADGKFTDKTYASLVELCADICQRYNLNPLVDIIRHYDVTGKKCPLYWVNHPGDFVKFKDDVKKYMEPVRVITTPAEAIDRLVKIGVITSPDYWHLAIKCAPFLDILLVNAAKACKDYKTGNVTIFDDAVQKLKSTGVINTPEFWIRTNGAVKYTDVLICAIASRL